MCVCVCVCVCHRDPRATMNALYDAASVQLLLTLATEHEWPLLFITNNVCNTLLCFNDGTLLSEVRVWCVCVCVCVCGTTP